MEKSKVKEIENKARKLMNSSEDELKRMKKGSLSYTYYYILEDANFHKANNILESSGVYKGKYGEDMTEYDDYRASGGRTWRL